MEKSLTSIDQEMKTLMNKMYFGNSDNKNIDELKSEYEHLKYQRFKNLVKLPPLASQIKNKYATY